MDTRYFSGIFRLLGKRKLVGRSNRNKGSLFIRIEHRYKLGAEITPSKLDGIFDNPGPALVEVMTAEKLVQQKFLL